MASYQRMLSEELEKVASKQGQQCYHDLTHEARICEFQETIRMFMREAREFCDSLRHALCSALPGYNEAEWEVAA